MVGLILWLSVQYFVLGPYSLVLFGDEGDSHLSGLLSQPHLDTLFPLWAPFAAAGTDRLALGYSPPMLAVLFNIFPGWLAYAIAHMAMTAGAAVGIFMLCRKCLRLEIPGAFFATLLFASAISLTKLVAYPLALAPLAILALSNLLDDRSQRRNWIWAGVAMAIYSLTASMTLLILFPAIFFGVWFLVFERRFYWKEWAIIVLFFVGVYVLRGQDVFAMALNAGLSPRADWVHQNLTIAEAFFDGVGRVLSLVDPSSLVPKPPVMRVQYSTFATYTFIIGAFLIRVRPPTLIRLIQLFVSCSVLVVLIPIFKSLLFDAIPLIRGFTFNKVMVFLPILSFMGAGYVVDAVLASSNRAKGLKYAAAMFGVILLLGIVEKAASSGFEWISHGGYTLNYRSPVIEKLAKRINDRKEKARVASFQMYDVTPHAYGLETPGGKLDMFSKRYNQFWLEAVLPSTEKFPSETFHMKTYGYMELGLTYVNPDKKPVRIIGDLYRLNMFSLLNVRYFLSRDRLTDPQFRELNFPKPNQPWSALDRHRKIRANFSDNFNGRSHIYVYENTEALPRFFLTKKVVPLDGRDAVLKAIAATDTIKLRRTVFVDHADLPSGLDERAKFSTDGNLTIEHYGADRIDISVRLNGDTLMVGANSYSPFWKAYVDGRQAKIFPAYVALWGIRLPADAKKVSFRYEPPYNLFRF